MLIGILGLLIFKENNLIFLETDLDVHLNDGFPNQSGSEESPERNEEVSTSDSSQVKQRIGDLKHTFTFL